MASRITSHVIEEKGENIFRTIICNENVLYRNITGRDYGVDGIVEIFDENDNPTGKIAYIQIKSTKNRIQPMKTQNMYVACNKISKSNLMYATQKKIPFILVYCCINESGFYYKLLNENAMNIRNIKNDNTIRILLDNYIENDSSDLVRLISEFYE